jgi:hypothetical protein
MIYYCIPRAIESVGWVLNPRVGPIEAHSARGVQAYSIPIKSSKFKDVLISPGFPGQLANQDVAELH